LSSQLMISNPNNSGHTKFWLKIVDLNQMPSY
jgi:hypothetical protein